MACLATQLMSDLFARSAEKSITTKAGQIRYQEFYPKLSKSIVDQIDAELARAWGLMPEALDFVVNYDIKYRLGQSIEDADDD